ncbi:MAG: hypothetical protein ACO3XP_10145 [Ilumatobacteraceae bacterium]
MTDGDEAPGSPESSETAPDPIGPNTSQDSKASSGKGWIIGLLVAILIVVVGLFLVVANSDGEGSDINDQAEMSDVAEDEAEDPPPDEVQDGEKSKESSSAEVSTEAEDSAEEEVVSYAGTWFQDLLDSIAGWLSGLFESANSNSEGSDSETQE